MHCLLENEVDVEVAGQVVDRQVLPIEAHVGEKIQLVTVVLHDGRVLREQFCVWSGSVAAAGGRRAARLRGRRLRDLVCAGFMNIVKLMSFIIDGVTTKMQTRLPMGMFYLLITNS